MNTSEPTPMPNAAPRGYWRAATYFCLLLLAVGATAGISMYQQFVAQLQDLQHKVQQTAQLQFVAVLQDAQGAPAMLVTQLSGDGYLQLQRLNAVVEGAEDSMQLWAMAAAAGAASAGDAGDTGSTGATTPRSLGILPPKLKTLRLTATDTTLAGVGQLGMSVEAKGGVSERQGPRLPYVFTGTVIRKAF